MTINDLVKQLTDNLTDEQKAMDAEYLDSNGEIYTINTVFIAAIARSNQMIEGQPVLCSFGDKQDTED